MEPFIFCSLKQEMLKIVLTGVAAQSWCMVVSTIIKIQRVPVMLSSKTHNLDLRRQILKAV